MAFYNLKMAIECKDEKEAQQLQEELREFRLLSAKMVRGLIALQKKKPKLVRSVLSAASSGNITQAMSGIMQAM